MSSVESRYAESVRHHRMSLAVVFLDTVVVPYLNKLADKSTFTRAKFDEMEAQFKAQYLIVGNDFTSDHVWGISWARVMAGKDKPEMANTQEFAQNKAIWEVLTAIFNSSASEQK